MWRPCHATVEAAQRVFRALSPQGECFSEIRTQSSAATNPLRGRAGRRLEWNQDTSPGPRAGVEFIVGGYDKDAPYGDVCSFRVPSENCPVPQHRGSFGITWGGQLEIANRVLQGYDSQLIPILRERFDLSDPEVNELETALRQKLVATIPYQILPLQDCVNLATFLIRTTMTAQSLSVDVRGVGGMIDVATITRTEGVQWIQQKQLKGEIEL